MPLFFIISGYLFKPLTKLNEVKAKSGRKIIQLMTPYFSYGFLLIFIIYLMDSDSSAAVGNAVNLIYGGEMLKGYFGVFWFITVLLLTQILYSVLQWKFKTRSLIAIVILCFIFAQIVSHSQFLSSMAPPWNLDVVLLSLVYFAIGSFARNYKHYLFDSIYPLIVAGGASIGLVYLQLTGSLNYSLDMKYNVYTHPVLDLLIPLLFSFVIVSFSFHISKRWSLKSLSYLGENSLTIMYLHIPVNLLIGEAFHVPANWILFSVAGVAIPILIHRLVLSKYELMGYFFLGARKKPTSRQQTKIV